MTSETPEQVEHHARVLAWHDPGGGDFEATCARFAELFRQLVPDRGPAASPEGQVLLAVGRLAGEHRRNGNLNWGLPFEGFVDALAAHLLEAPTLEDRWPRIEADLALVLRSGRDGDVPQETCRVTFGRLIADAVAFCDPGPSAGRVERP